MFIHSLYYKDHSTGWTLGTPDEPMVFDRLTLLVGASGVGKTQTLKAILNLQKIANGESLNGVEWDVIFSLDDGSKCRWCGQFQLEKAEPSFLLDMSKILTQDYKREFILINEQMYIDEILTLERKQGDIIFEGKSLIKLPSTESFVHLLREDDIVKKIYINLNLFFYVNSTDISKKHMFFLTLSKINALENCKTLESLRAYNEETLIKLFIAYKNNIPIFQTIKSLFFNIFSTVCDIKYDIVDDISENVPQFLKSMPVLQIKEKNSQWIDESNISSGMYRTLAYLSEVLLCPDNSLILIDEFENSLGINCIDEVTSSILSQNRNLQFILTSHHPYIINHISSEHWKILTRKGGVVKSHNAKDVGIGKSKHAAFTQLINLDMYNTGMEE